MPPTNRFLSSMVLSTLSWTLQLITTTGSSLRTFSGLAQAQSASHVPPEKTGAHWWLAVPVVELSLWHTHSGQHLLRVYCLLGTALRAPSDLLNNL